MFPQTHPRSKFSLYSCLQKIIVFDTSLQSVCSSRCFQSQYYTLIPQSHKFLSEQQDLAVHTTFASGSYRAGHSAHYKTLAQNCKQQLWFWGPIWWLLKHLSVQRKKIQFVWQKSRTDLTNWFGSKTDLGPSLRRIRFHKGQLGDALHNSLQATEKSMASASSSSSSPFHLKVKSSLWYPLLPFQGLRFPFWIASDKKKIKLQSPQKYPNCTYDDHISPFTPFPEDPGSPEFNMKMFRILNIFVHL